MISTQSYTHVKARRSKKNKLICIALCRINIPAPWYIQRAMPLIIKILKRLPIGLWLGLEPCWHFWTRNFALNSQPPRSTPGTDCVSAAGLTIQSAEEKHDTSKTTPWMFKLKVSFQCFRMTSGIVLTSSPCDHTRFCIVHALRHEWGHALFHLHEVLHECIISFMMKSGTKSCISLHINDAKNSSWFTSIIFFIFHRSWWITGLFFYRWTKKNPAQVLMMELVSSW